MGADMVVSLTREHREDPKTEKPTPKSMPEYRHGNPDRYGKFIVSGDFAFYEYRFKITSETKFRMQEFWGFPKDFVKSNRNVLAAINGVYWNAAHKPEGALYSGKGYIGTETPEFNSRQPPIFGFFDKTRREPRYGGYLSVDLSGNEVRISETLHGNHSDYWLVVGTHPLLVMKGKIHPQAIDPHYNRTIKEPKAEKQVPYATYRSAIGIREIDQKTYVSFIVSMDRITMSDWAKKLKDAGFAGAINIDGGPVSQLATRDASG